MGNIRRKEREYVPSIAKRKPRRRQRALRSPITPECKRRSTKLSADQQTECHYGDEGRETDVDRCHCGCDRQLTRMLSVLLQRYFCSKRKWLRSLKVPKWRPQELERINALILEKGYHEFEVNNLDLDIIQLDVSRQQWLTDQDNADLVKQALITFCVVNDVGYWQGLHDVAAALAHLTPRPSIGELVAILEKLVLNFASILLRVTDENIVSDASKISAKWRLMFQFFFPKAAKEMDKLSDSNSWNINWFLTMGFYRFGCAHIVLAYVYTVILCSSGCMTAFMYQELGYLGVKGHMRWLMSRNVECSHVVDNLFDDGIDDALLSKALTNSKMIQLDAEELINVSRNLYDTLNGTDCEIANFPLVKILKFASFYFNKSPMSLYKNNDVQVKTVVQIGISDIFKGQETHRANEGQSKRSQIMTNCSTRSTHTCKHSLKISESLNNEMLNIYLKNLHANVLKKSFIYPSRFVGGISQKGSFYYNIVDVRSQYLTYGEPLDSFFGTEAVTYINEDEIADVMKDANFSPIFTIWIIVTDDGYDHPEDHTSLESLDKGVDIYSILARSYSGVALLRGGYTALLRWKNLPMPSRYNIPLFRKLMEWIPTTREPVPKISIENVLSSYDDPFYELSARLRRDVTARQNMFVKSTALYEVGMQGYSREHIACGRYAVAMCLGNGMWAKFNSEGGMIVNGMTWHPHFMARRKSSPGPSVVFYVASHFQVTSVDGILEVVPRDITLPGVRNIVKRHISDFHESLDGQAVVVRSDRGPSEPVPSRRLLKVVTRLIATCKNARRLPILQQWIVELVSPSSAIHTLLAYEVTLTKRLNSASEGASYESDYDEEEEEEEEKDDEQKEEEEEEDIFSQNRGKEISEEILEDVKEKEKYEGKIELPEYSEKQPDNLAQEYIAQADVPTYELNHEEEFIVKHPFAIPLEQVIQMEHAVHMANHGPQLERPHVYVNISYRSTDMRQPLSSSSDHRTHVFSRRIKSHPKPVETRPKACALLNKPQNAVQAAKTVFVPRSQIKRNQNA